MSGAEITAAETEALFRRLLKEAAGGGYFLNPDADFTKALAKSLLINERRYGYQACPCRLADGAREKDSDIICPCDYRDADLSEFGACFCGLYVAQAAAKGEAKIASIPERRPPPEKRAARPAGAPASAAAGGLPYPVWRCKVCGYLCARPEPPELCPVCKVRKDRFERFM